MTTPINLDDYTETRHLAAPSCEDELKAARARADGYMNALRAEGMNFGMEMPTPAEFVFAVKGLMVVFATNARKQAETEAREANADNEKLRRQIRELGWKMESLCRLVDGNNKARIEWYWRCQELELQLSDATLWGQAADDCKSEAEHDARKLAKALKEIRDRTPKVCYPPDECRHGGRCNDLMVLFDIAFDARELGAKYLEAEAK